MKKTRKFICLVLASLLLLANLLTVAPMATENTSTAVVDPKYIIDFSADSRYQDGSALKMAAPTYCSVEYGKDGDIDYAKFTPTATNKNYSIGSYSDFVPTENDCIKIRLKNNTPGTIFELWFAHDGSASTLKRLKWTVTAEDDDWKEYTFHMTQDSISGANGIDLWSQNTNIPYLRLDMVNDASTHNSSISGTKNNVMVDYIAIFSSKAEADAFDISQWKGNGFAWLSDAEYKNLITDKKPSILFDLRASQRTALEGMNPILGSNGTLEYMTSYVTLTATQDNANPNWTFNLDDSLDTSVCGYVKFGIKNESSVPGFEFWYSSEGNVNKNTAFQISTNDSDFKTYTFCVKDGGTAQTFPYLGRIGNIRLDFMDATNVIGGVGDGESKRASVGEKIHIEYVAFFATQEAADAFDINEYRYGLDSYGSQCKLDTDNYSVRFVSTVNSLDVDAIGYEIKATGAGVDKEWDKTCSTVYTSILANGTPFSAETLGGTYICTMTVQDISIEQYGEITFTATPYILVDGRKLYADPIAVVYHDGVIQNSN